MTSQERTGSAATPLTRALETIKKLKARLDEQSENQPLAVVGVGLRLPGGIDDLDSYWQALEEGRDLVRTRPESRMEPFAEKWATLPHRGSFLDEVLEFDAAFFGISPREARAIDPQHRLLLEVAWEALENAALPPDRLRDIRVGTYVGITGRQDYADWLTGDMDAYWATGNGNSFAAGRVAYSLGLTGPAVAIDTACASSLVAIHQAGAALRRGEVDVALAGGVNLVVSPGSTEVIVQTRSLSPDGLCKAFDARANGFVRGEGCGLLVLKRLDHARRDGDRVLAVIHGSATNQDGRSSGFTAPNVLAQIDLIEAALADAGLTPADIGLVEAHGTGTSLGDPIEMDAIVAALGRKNDGAPLHVGSAKTNLGHLEGASGVAGVIKGILCVQKKAIPPLVHFQTLNPRIDIDGTGITLSNTVQPWETGKSGAYVGVSAFGIVGTNAHVIIGPADDEPSPATDTTPAPVAGFEIAAKTPQALRALAADLAGRLGTLPDQDYPAFAYTTTFGRARHDVRARVEAADPSTAAAALSAFAAGDESAAVTVTDSEPTGQDTGFGDLPRRILELPHYPWQRQRHAPAPRTTSPAAAPAPDPATTGGQAVPLYTLDWQPTVLPAAAGTTPVVLAGDDAELLGLLLRQARADGLHGTVLGPLAATGDAHWTVAGLPADDAAWSTFWAGHTTGPVTLVVAMEATRLPESLDSGRDIAAAAAALCAKTNTAVRALHTAATTTGRAYAVTRGVRQVTDQDTIVPGDHGLLHGLAPVLGLEMGETWGGIIDLPAAPTPQDAHSLLRLVCAADGEDLVAIRGGGPFVGRLRPAPATYAPELPVTADATYLITGGLGGVGRAMAADLVRRGARHLLLIGRTPETSLGADAGALLEELRGDNVTVAYRSADLDDPAALSEAFGVLAELPAVRGVIHGAGTLPEALLADADAAGFEAALRGKFTGAWWLHLLTRDWPLDFFVQTSSVSALWGNEGRGAYAAANGGIDALAAYRLTTGLKATSIAYGAWGLDGMADADTRRDLARMGIIAMDGPAGCATLSAQAPGTDALLVAAPMDWPRFVEVLGSVRRRPLFDVLVPPVAAVAEQTAQEPAPVAVSAIRAELLALPEGARSTAARAHVGGLVAATLGHETAADVPDDVGFFDLGLDSIMAIDLARELAVACDLRLKVADIFSHPTVAGLAAFIAERVADPTAFASAPAHTPRPGHPQAQPPARTVRAAIAAPEDPAAPFGAAGPQTHYNEPIAIVGMAGRFPGADSADELWDVLRTGRDTVSTVPADRWDVDNLHDTDPLRAGKITSDQGGFLTDISRFDASFFGITAREAESLDPQQRLLLESAWHALEDGNIDPKSLKDTHTGVFVGVTNSDYARLLERGGLEGLDAYFVSGTALNAAAGRIAFTLGLNGPAMAVDTACSSSLSAIHLAVRSLRSGESDQVLAGGVNLITAPSCSVAVSRAHMLSPDGRCKTFSDQANGFVRAEGVGVLVLKRLSDAQRDGDRVHALIHGSAVNQDGASSGLTVPSGKAQEAVITASIADAGIQASDISYLEAHGTGTSLGDPIELNAAWSVLGEGRKPGDPLYIGSVKSNIGHCESASGLAGIFKTVLALRHGKLPASLHCDTLNQHIPWDEMNVRVVDSLTPWRSKGGPRLAGVSSFGFSGTNAHVIVGEAPTALPGPDHTADGPFLLPLSAPDPAGFERVVQAWQGRLNDAVDDSELAALATTAGAGRAHFPIRRALFAESRQELLTALSEGGVPAPAGRRPRIGFLFSGAGSQYFGMGQELYETEPVFRQAIDDCGRILSPLLGIELRDLMFYGADEDLVDQIQYTQPATVAIELALAQLWKSWGVTPTVVTGHSVGEIAAAVVAGVMDLPTGLTLVARRAALMATTPPGSMLSLAAPLDQVTGWLAGTDCDVAALNGPQSIVVAGPLQDVKIVAGRARAENVKARELTISSAAHSRLIDPMVAELTRFTEALEFRAPQIPVVSNLTGKAAAIDAYDSAYWAQQVRQPVRFYESAQTLQSMGVDVLLELGPDQTLVNMVTAAGALPAGGAVSSLQRGNQERAAMLTAAALLYNQGQDLGWRAVQAATGGSRAAAPGYPYAATRYWTKVPAALPAAPPAADTRRHWGTELRSSQLKGRVFAFERSADFPAYLTDHRIEETVLTPASSHLATILSAIAGQGEPVVFEDFVCPRPLVIKDGERYDAQILLEEDQGAPTVSLHSLVDPAAGTWEKHLSARIGDPAATASRPTPDTAAFIATAERHIGRQQFYDYFRELGYTLGPSFRWIDDIWVKGDEALIRYTQPPTPGDLADYEIFPGLIDSCFQTTAAFMVDDPAQKATTLAIPFSATTLAFPGRPGRDGTVWSHIRALQTEPLPNDRMRVETADLHMFTGDGQSIMIADGFRVRSARRAALRQSLRGGEPNAYELAWIAEPRYDAAGQPGRTVAVLGADTGPARSVTEALRALGHTVLDPAADTAPPSADLVIDARFCGGADAAGALTAARTLAAGLRTATRTVPYTVLAAGGPQAATLRETLWGMLAALESEDAERRLLRVTLDDGWDPRALAGTLTLALDHDIPETRLALDGHGVRVARLTPSAAAPDSAQWPTGVLLTGGLGALGLGVAQVLARQGARDITLMARSAPDTVAQQVIDELIAAGTTVRVVAGDVTDPAACAAAVAAASQDTPLNGVFHLAGTTADRAFDSLTDQDYEHVFAGKVLGAQNLAAATAHLALDTFVLFSSAAAVLGSPGQVNYGAANGFLSGLAEALRASGVPATSVQWGPWVSTAKGGMAAAAAAEKAAQRMGIGRLSDETAEPILALAVTSRQPRLLAVDLDITLYRQALGGHPRSALVAELAAPAQPEAAAPDDLPAGEKPRGWLRDLVAGLPADERDDQLRETLQATVGDLLGEPGTVIDDDLGFEDAGLDSIMVLDFGDLLTHALDAELPATIAIDYPNMPDLVRFLAQHVLLDPQAPDAPDAAGDDLSAMTLSDEQLMQAVQRELTMEL